jgi:hypothetical protein
LFRGAIRSKLAYVRLQFLAFALAVAAFVACLGNTQGQSADGSAIPQAGIVITKLRDPVYPLIARTAGIHGDITLALQIRPDGTLEFVEYVSGPPLLKKAAIDSAKESQFTCRGCSSNASVSYSLVYTFQFTNEDCCNSGDTSHVSVSGNHIWITTAPFCFCDPPAMTRVRSIKCLYLWRCARH